MANDKGSKKPQRRSNALTANDVASMFQSAAWYASQNGVKVETESGTGGLVIRLPTLEAIEDDTGALIYKAKES